MERDGMSGYFLTALTSNETIANVVNGELEKRQIKNFKKEHIGFLKSESKIYSKEQVTDLLNQLGNKGVQIPSYEKGLENIKLTYAPNVIVQNAKPVEVSYLTIKQVPEGYVIADKSSVSQSSNWFQ